jgi:hypothetical protein
LQGLLLPMGLRSSTQVPCGLFGNLLQQLSQLLLMIWLRAWHQACKHV